VLSAVFLTVILYDLTLGRLTNDWPMVWQVIVGLAISMPVGILIFESLQLVGRLRRDHRSK